MTAAELKKGAAKKPSPKVTEAPAETPAEELLGAPAETPAEEVPIEAPEELPAEQVTEAPAETVEPEGTEAPEGMIAAEATPMGQTIKMTGVFFPASDPDTPSVIRYYASHRETRGDKEGANNARILADNFENMYRENHPQG